MPRVHRKGHRVRGVELSREEALAELLKPGSFALCQSPDRVAALATFPAKERGEIYAEACQVDWERREAQREPILRSRLLEWDVSQWGSVFCERPDLLDTLDAEQRGRWDTWRAKSQPAASEKSTLRLITTKRAPGVARS